MSGKKLSAHLGILAAALGFQACGNQGPTPTNLQQPVYSAPVVDSIQRYFGYWSTGTSLFEFRGDSTVKLLYSSLRSQEHQIVPLRLIQEYGRVYLISEFRCDGHRECGDHDNRRGGERVPLKSRELLRLDDDGNISLFSEESPTRMGALRGRLRRIDPRVLDEEITRLRVEHERGEHRIESGRNERSVTRGE